MVVSTYVEIKYIQYLSLTQNIINYINMENVKLPQLIHALNKYMDSTSKLKAIRQAVGSTDDIWELFWNIATQDQTLYQNLYNNISSFYDESTHEFSFNCEEKIYKEANYEMFLKQVLRYIDPITYTTAKLEKDSWKIINSINIIKDMLICLFVERKLPVGSLYEVNVLRNKYVHKGRGNSNRLMQLALVGMYIATCVAKRAKENQIVAGIILDFGECKVSSSDMIPAKAILKYDATPKRILLPECLFDGMNPVSLPIQIYKNNSIVYKEQVQIERGEFKTIKPPKAAPASVTKNSLSEKKREKKNIPTKEHNLYKWFIRHKKQIKQAALLLLPCVAIIIGISLITSRMKTEKLQENDFYPSIEGTWIIKSMDDNKRLGVAEITSTNEYGTQGRIVTMLFDHGEEVYEFTLNRNTGMLNIERNIQTQVECVNKIIKLQFIFKQWKLEKYN